MPEHVTRNDESPPDDTVDCLVSGESRAIDHASRIEVELGEWNRINRAALFIRVAEAIDKLKPHIGSHAARHWHSFIRA